MRCLNLPFASDRLQEQSLNDTNDEGGVLLQTLKTARKSIYSTPPGNPFKVNHCARRLDNIGRKKAHEISEDVS